MLVIIIYNATQGFRLYVNRLNVLSLLTGVVFKIA